MAKRKEVLTKKNWVVTMRCVVTKTFELAGCTKEEARHYPWTFVQSSQEQELLDWEVTKIEENR